MSRIAQHHRPSEAEAFATAARRLQHDILSSALDSRRQCLVADYGGTEVDAALLQAVTLRLLPPKDARMKATVEAVAEDLSMEGWIRRYRTRDDFGVPEVAFTLCTFWMIEALAMVGRVDEARALMEKVRGISSPLGLLSEDVDPKTGQMWGNFPQAYSHVGMIQAAFAAAPRWSEVV